jgi:hypothetical protein
MFATVPNEANATTLFQPGRDLNCSVQSIGAVFESFIKLLIISIKSSSTLCPGIQQKRDHQIFKAIKISDELYVSNTFSHVCFTGIKPDLLKEEGRSKLCNLVTQPGGFLEQAGVPFHIFMLLRSKNRCLG